MANCLPLVLIVTGLAGCGTTVQMRPIAPAVSAHLHPRDLPGGSLDQLQQWAGKNPERLVRVAEALLVRSTGDAREGNRLLAAYFAEKALVLSGVKSTEWQSLPSTQPAVSVYRRALTGFLQKQKQCLIDGQANAFASDWGTVSVADNFAVARYPEGYFDRLILADAIAIRGFRDRVTLAGLGVPLVGLRESTPERAAEMALNPPKGVTVPLNALIEFPPDFHRNRRATIRLTNSLETNRGMLAGRPVQLAADFTAPLAFTFGGSNDLLVGIRNFINVGLGVQSAGIYLAEPPDPKRIPVLLIHGLSSSPIVWRNVVNEAMRDPVIRKRYQFWHAFYSTGAPLVHSTSQIRGCLNELRAKYPDSRISNDLVIVGYSMGGVMARLLVTDIGDHLWNAISAVPFEKVRLDPEDAAEIRNSVFWQPEREVDQVIFIATPHRGTRMAEASFAHLARWLIRLPSDYLRFQRRIVEALDDALGGHAAIRSRLTGLDDLSYRSPLYAAIDVAPMEKGLSLHSIIGDRGRGDTPDSSDGIVAYWSSHLAQADSELIVPTGHNAQASPKTEAEIYRILNLDWGEVRKARDFR